MMTGKYDVSAAASVFAVAHHKRQRDTYAREQIAAAEALCLSVLEAAASRGFCVKPESQRAWCISAANETGDAHVSISDQGDIQVRVRQFESPRPLAIRYDVLGKAFVSTGDTSYCVARTLADAIVAALDEGWERVSRTGRLSQP